MKYFIVAFCVLLLLSSCNNSLDDIMDDYNSAFEKEDDNEVYDADVLYPGDPGFDETKMLYEKYFFSDNEELNLTAPSARYSATSYSWKLTLPDDETWECNSAKLAAGTTYSSRRFVMYAPLCELKSGKTYKLTLTVTVAGKTYTDSCAIVFYNHIEP